MKIRFTHGLPFNAIGVLRAAGIMQSDPKYILLVPSVLNTIETTVEIAAKTLNERLLLAWLQAMSVMPEYNRLPGYATALTMAMRLPEHTSIDWRNGVAHAKFVDTTILGDLKDLQDVQSEAYPVRGSLTAWVRLYNAWINGSDRKIEDTLNTRVGIMIARRMAPFWILVEDGNDMYPAYPQNSGAKILARFAPEYKQEMIKAFRNAVATTKLMSMAMGASFPKLGSAMINVGGKTLVGFKWVSRSGNIIFSQFSNTSLIGGRLVSSGFVLSPAGDILKKWSGWLPR